MSQIGREVQLYLFKRNIFRGKVGCQKFKLIGQIMTKL